MSRVDALLRAGRIAEAVHETDARTTLDVWRAIGWYDFARVYAVASVHAPAVSVDYSDRVIALLRKAVKAGFKNAASIHADSALDPLRDRVDFKQILADLEKV